MKPIIEAWLIAIIIIAGAARASAQTQAEPAPASARDLSEISLEELMNLEVTSASKKEEKLFQTAAAIYVITREDIRRSGLTNIPELLRLAPGLQVARIDGNKWAISSRGLNGRFANKLLVLIDGRSVYSPETGGVYWESQDLPVEEIERIEVIRGPGGALWGANAVNGVINIITRHAREAQGGSITAGGGSEEQGFGTARYGARIGANAYYRIYTRYFNRAGLAKATGRDADDGQHAASGGFRLDWKRSDHDALTWQGDIYDTGIRETSINIRLTNPFDPPANTPGEFTGGNLLARWSHFFSERSESKLQIYYDRTRREIYDLGERFDTLDLDFQHRQAIGRRQDLVWGLGYRRISDRNNSNSGTAVQYTPKRQTVQIFSGFAQDELTLIKNRLRLTVGAKLEHNDYSGIEFQPNVRLLWTPNQSQTFWAAVSRAVRTPTRGDQGLRVNVPAARGPGGLPVTPALLGNPGIGSEELRAYELGYRVQAGRRFSLDLATFYNHYNPLRTFEPGPPLIEFNPQPVHLVIPLRFGNDQHGEAYGVEASANLNLSSYWSIHCSHSFMRLQLHRTPASRDLFAENPEGEHPRHQFQLQSHFRLPRRFELDLSLYQISSLPGPRIPAYTRLDARFGWRAGENLELSLGLQNLLDKQHPEYGGVQIGVTTSEVKRSIYGKATWRF